MLKYLSFELMANAKIVVRISLGYKELSKPEESNNIRRIIAHHTELIPIDLHKLIKTRMANTVCCIHVLGDEKQHIHKRTPSRPISFYDCNERKNFFLRSKTIDRMKTNTQKTGVDSLQNPKAIFGARFICFGVVFRFESGIDRRTKNFHSHQIT